VTNPELIETIRRTAAMIEAHLERQRVAINLDNAEVREELKRLRELLKEIQ